MDKLRNKFWRTIVKIASTFCLLPFISCVARQHLGPFRVLPGSPNYLLRSPDRHDTPFPYVLLAYNGFERGRSSMDLHSLMELRIENAYYQKGASRRGLAGFLGTEVARYEVMSHGLRLLSVQPMKDRPEDELPVQSLISLRQRRFHYYRLYFEIFFWRNNDWHASVLLAANSTDELARLSGQLSQPETVCNERSTQCTVFPEACTVSVEMKIVVNGKSETVLWGSLLASVTDQPRNLKLQRLYNGRLTPVEIDPQYPSALRVPLLPGDQITWN